MGMMTLDNMVSVEEPKITPIESHAELWRKAKAETDELFGTRQDIPEYDAAEADAVGKVSSYSDMVRTLAGNMAPKGETDKERKSRRWNAAISAIGDVLTHGLNAAGAANGGNAMTLDPSQSLSALSKARYDKIVATNQANRDKYLSLLLKAADIDTKYGGTAKTNYAKAYDAKVKGINASNAARDAYAKGLYNAMAADNAATDKQNERNVKNYQWGMNYNQDERIAAAPTTTTQTVSGTRKAISTNPLNGEVTLVDVPYSSTTTSTRGRKL